jgi:hypothetical protein
MKKPVVRSPLELLPISTKAALKGWLSTGGPHGGGITYKAAVRKLREEHGITTSQTALCAFFRRHARPASATVDTVESATTRTITIVITLPK